MREPKVAVHPPDSRGLREVTLSGKRVGSAWSARDLRRVLTRFGHPRDADLDDRTSIRWLGGGSDVWPDRRARRLGVMGLMVAGLAASMVMLVVIGKPDALGALTFAGRLTGFLFVIAGLAQGGAAFAALDYWGKREHRFSGVLVLLGVLITFAGCFLLLFIWFEEREYTRYALAFFPLFGWSLWGIWLLGRDRVWRGIPHPRKIAVGVVATGALAATNLGYSALYQPTSTPLVVKVDASFGTPRMDPSRPVVHLPVTFSAKNTGKVGVYVTNDQYLVQGRASAYSEKGAGLGEWKKVTLAQINDVGRYVAGTRVTTIATGPFYGSGAWLEPDEEYRVVKVVQVPARAGFDSIEAWLNVELMRKDRGRIDEVRFQEPHYSWEKSAGKMYCPECDEHTVHHARVRHNSNLINVTRRPRFITALWWAHPEGSKFWTAITTFDFVRRDEITDREVEREAERYGIAFAWTTAAVPFAALPTRPPAQGAE
ncbi:hypothetical protein [Streptomyces sp. NPDC090022]|uniref:hypothetical protein n=1 Tax=Streptomyces sp. NPDC090022 TaxID=3365920 RepID=UPI0038058CBE